MEKPQTDPMTHSCSEHNTTGPGRVRRPVTDASLQAPLPGAGMDKKVVRKKSRVRKITGFLMAGLVVVALVVNLVNGVNRGKSLTVVSSRLDIDSVFWGTYEDFIPVRAKVEPSWTVYLDAIEGGRVEKRWVEDGAEVSKGQLILELSNTNLQLSVMRNEAEVIQQLNNMHTIELALAQNRLSHKRNLVEINYQITRLTRLAKRQRVLFSEGNLSRAALDATEDELHYVTELRSVTRESQANDRRLQRQQIAFLKSSAKDLQDNLNFARANIDRLKIRAPLAGRLSGFQVEIGESIARGGRLGQVDDPDNFKFTADIDEFYLGRVALGQRATYGEGSAAYVLEIAKIYPQVIDGKFKVDMTFTDQQPVDVRRGQTIQTRLILGGSSQTLLIPNGAFYQESGGHWIFVVNAEGTEAVRRPIRTGRRNQRFIEVIEGVSRGDRVITSSYGNYKEIARLKLDAGDAH